MSARMHLVRIADLVGKDIKGLKADIRTRNADGTLKYTGIGEDKPIMVTMLVVEYITKKNGPTLQKISGREKDRWLYWRHEGYGCGYSGNWAGDGKHLDNYLMIEKRGEA